MVAGRLDFPSTLDHPLVINALRVKGAAGPMDPKDLLLAVRRKEFTGSILVDGVVFIQRETPNRNFVRFRPSALGRLARTLRGVPFLRDHRQRDLDARGGTVTESALEDHPDGKAIRQTIEIVKPWAQEAALDGTMDRFSIGWHSGATDVVCSICEAPFVDMGFFGSMSECGHNPGDTVTLKDGTEKVVEMLYLDAEGVETSAVTVPAIVGTGIDSVRMQLAAARENRNVRPTDNVIRAAPSAGRKEIKMSHFGKLATVLSLAEDADEDAVVGSIQKLLKEVESKTTLLAAERQARDTTQEALDTANAEVGAIRQARHEAQVDEILETSRRRGALNPKTVLDENGKPKRVEGPAEAAIRDMARTLGIDAARDYANSLPSQNVPIGPSIYESTTKGAKRPFVAPAGGSILKQLGVSMDDVRKYGRLDRAPAPDFDEEKE